MIADYLNEAGEPDVLTPRSASGVNSDMDRAKFMLPWRSALAASSSLAFPGFLINRALPGAVVAAIAFAVPGLSLEHHPVNGDAASRLATAGLGAAQKDIEIAPPVTSAKAERNPPEVRFALPVLASPDPMNLSNISLNSAGTKRAQADTSTLRESGLTPARPYDGSETQPTTEAAAQGSAGLERSQARMSRNDGNELANPLVAEATRSLTVSQAPHAVSTGIGGDETDPESLISVAAGASAGQELSLQSPAQLDPGDHPRTIAFANSGARDTEVKGQSAAPNRFPGEREAHAYDVAALDRYAFQNGEFPPAGVVDPAPQAAAELSRTGATPGEAAGNLVSAAANGLADHSQANALASPERPETAAQNRSAAANSLAGPPEAGVGDAHGPAKLAHSSTQAAPVGKLNTGTQAEIGLDGYAEQAPVPRAVAGASQIQEASQGTVALARRVEMPTPLVRGSDRTAGIAEAPGTIQETLQENPGGEPAFAPRLKSGSFVAGWGTNGASAVEITSRLATRIDGRVAGELDFQQDMETLKVRIGSIVELLKDRYETAELNRIARSASGDVYLSIAQLQQAGIPISYDPVYDELAIGTKDYLPRAAHKVQVDQITAPQRDLGPIVMEQVPR